MQISSPENDISDPITSNTMLSPIGPHRDIPRRLVIAQCSADPELSGTGDFTTLQKTSSRHQDYGSPTSVQQELKRAIHGHGRSQSFSSVFLMDDNDNDRDAKSFSSLPSRLQLPNHLRSMSADASVNTGFVLHPKRSLYRDRRCNSCPSQYKWLLPSDDERRLRQRRTMCESTVQKLYEERKDHIMEIFEDSWVLTTPLDDDNDDDIAC